MAVNILVRDYDLPISGSKEGIAVSYDVHVRRVFLRTGLARNDTEDEIVGTARELNPDYPGDSIILRGSLGALLVSQKEPRMLQVHPRQGLPQEFSKRRTAQGIGPT
jgi:hypothetical protein